MAESKIGAGKGKKNLMMLTLGTGVGGSVMIDSKIHQGKGQRAGHLGHVSLDYQGTTGITGMPGSLEDAIGNATISVRTKGKYSSTSKLVEDYGKGNTYATKVWLDSVRKLAIGLASFCNILSPDLIIIGGGISKAGNALFGPLNEFMDLYEWRPGGLKTSVVKAECNEFAGAFGAAFFALEKGHKPKSMPGRL
jgi:glucokinase